VLPWSCGKLDAGVLLCAFGWSEPLTRSRVLALLVGNIVDMGFGAHESFVDQLSGPNEPRRPSGHRNDLTSLWAS
jgi:hypothetical protein